MTDNNEIDLEFLYELKTKLDKLNTGLDKMLKKLKGE